MRRFLANLSNIFPLGGTGYVKDIQPSERIPPKGFGSAVPAPDAFPLQYPGFSAPTDRLVVVKSNPGVNVGKPAPSLAMEATIDGHTYKGVLYLEQEQEG